MHRSRRPTMSSSSGEEDKTSESEIEEVIVKKKTSKTPNKAKKAKKAKVVPSDEESSLSDAGDSELDSSEAVPRKRTAKAPEKKPAKRPGRPRKKPSVPVQELKGVANKPNIRTNIMELRFQAPCKIKNFLCTCDKYDLSEIYMEFKKSGVVISAARPKEGGEGVTGNSVSVFFVINCNNVIHYYNEHDVTVMCRLIHLRQIFRNATQESNDVLFILDNATFMQKIYIELRSASILGFRPRSNIKLGKIAHGLGVPTMPEVDRYTIILKCRSDTFKKMTSTGTAKDSRGKPRIEFNYVDGEFSIGSTGATETRYTMDEKEFEELDDFGLIVDPPETDMFQVEIDSKAIYDFAAAKLSPLVRVYLTSDEYIKMVNTVDSYAVYAFIDVSDSAEE